MAVSALPETEMQLRTQLNYLYMQVLSTLTLPQIAHVFKRRENFDLRRLLGGTEKFLDAISDAMTKGDTSLLLGALECLKMRKSHRSIIHAVLNNARGKSLLYGMVVADNRLVGVIRPKQHSLHPSDMQILFSMAFNSQSLRNGEHWIPVCLPRFNPNGFLHAYFNFFMADTVVILISTDKDAFFSLSTMKDAIVDGLEKEGMLELIQKILNERRYTMEDVGATPVRHFLYKSRGNVQFTMPNAEEPSVANYEHREILQVYRQLHGSIHSKTSQSRFLFVSLKRFCALAWVSSTFELYCIAPLSCSKQGLIGLARVITQWIRQEHERLFISSGAIF